MKNVNDLVNQVKEQGTESIPFMELFETLNKETIEPKAKSFSRQLKGDEAEAHSEGYTLMMELVESWDGTGNFHTLFKSSYENRLKNLIKYIGRNKRKHNTSYNLSLSDTTNNVMEGDEMSPHIETLNHPDLITTFDITDEHGQLEALLGLFGETNPEQAGLIEIMTTFGQATPQADKTNAYCNYFGVQEYSQVIQKRVSRARESFKKFLTKNDFQLSF